MVFRFTQKAQEKLKTGKLNTLPESDLFDEWYVNVFFNNRRKYYVATNAATLITAIIQGIGIKDDSDFFEHIFEAIEQQFNEISCPFIFKRNIAPKTADIILAKTINKQILGSMNDIISNAKFLIETNEMSPFDVSKDINETPFGYIDMDTPSMYMKKYRLFN